MDARIRLQVEVTVSDSNAVAEAMRYIAARFDHGYVDSTFSASAAAYQLHVSRVLTAEQQREVLDRWTS